MQKLKIILTAVLFLGNIARVSAAHKITVAVAANMQFVMELLQKDFEHETAIKVEVISGASGKITAQIIEGAPYDVFVSADTKFPEELFKKGMTVEAPKVYATGQLVLWTMRDDIKMTTGMGELTQDKIKKIAIANPKTAPYGTAAEEALTYFHLYDKLKSKLVYGENISQTEQFVATQAAEIGFIAKSLVLADELKNKGHWVDVDKKAYNPVKQGAVILKHGKDTNYADCQKFFQYLFSSKAKAVFRKYGYIVN